MTNKIVLSLLLLFALTERCFATNRDQSWNVVLILADDLGWTDLACYGSDFHETPQLDRLASQGMRFTQKYSACTVCSPTRAALLTGKYPARLHITDWIPGAMPDNPKLLVPDWTKFLPHNETTIAEVFRAAGYSTASIGKWHLGMEKHYPEYHGFDLNIAGTDKPQPASFIAPWKIPTLKEGREGEYLTDRIGNEAAKFIEASKDRPFFLYVPHFAVHTPIQGRPDLVEKYQAKLRPDLRHKNVQYAAMVESLDAAVGKILLTLDELKLADRTIVIFTSDNGGRITQGTTTNTPLRFGKASAYEGGVRVPLIIRWPGVVKPNSECKVPVISMDLFPTLVEACGLRITNDSAPTGASGHDGFSLMPVLRGKSTLARKEIFWHYPHHQHYQLGGTMPYGAMRAGDFKLIEFFNDMHVELYNLSNDIGEQQDLAVILPQQTDQMRRRLHKWREEVGAQMPTLNPQYDPARPEYTLPLAKRAEKGTSR
ncbi:MAG TPA: sulfatase [Pirellula sp.]|nr:sulfatase [Pirellula sp.]